MSFIISDIAATTGFISASGTGCAAPTRGSASLPRRLVALAAAVVLSAASAPEPSASLLVEVEGLRDHKGEVMFCLTRRTSDFMRCPQDPHALRSIALAGSGPVLFENLVPAAYALLVMHDANRNGRLDKRLGIPREGFGFSKNPGVRFGPPSAGEVRFSVPPGASKQVVRMKYIF